MLKKSYSWYHDRKTIGLIILCCGIALQLFAFLEVPGLTTLHSYTIGMVFGFYNPFFYLFVCYVGLHLLFEAKWKFARWIKLNATNYWIIVILIIFTSVATSFYQVATNYTSFGSKPWTSFNKWYDDFTSGGNAWLPANTNGGLLGALLYSLTAMVLSGIGAFIISILLIVGFFIYVGWKTWLTYRDRLKLKSSQKTKTLAAPPSTNKTTKINEQADDKELDHKNDINQKLEKRNGNETILPFDDPFQNGKK